MRKNGIDIIRIRAAAADEPQTEARVSFELAKFLRDESLKYLEKATRRPQLQRTKLYAYLKAVEKKRSLVKHEILECTRSRASGEIVLAVSEATRRRIRQAALARFEPIEKLRKKLLDLIKRADADCSFWTRSDVTSCGRTTDRSPDMSKPGAIVARRRDSTHP